MPLHRFETWPEFVSKLLTNDIPGGVLCHVQITDTQGTVLATGMDAPLVQIGDELKFIFLEGQTRVCRGYTFPVTRDGFAARMVVDGLPMKLPGGVGPFMLHKGDSFTLNA